MCRKDELYDHIILYRYQTIIFHKTIHNIISYIINRFLQPSFHCEIVKVIKNAID